MAHEAIRGSQVDDTIQVEAAAGDRQGVTVWDWSMFPVGVAAATVKSVAVWTRGASAMARTWGSTLRMAADVEASTLRAVSNCRLPREAARLIALVAPARVNRAFGCVRLLTNMGVQAAEEGAAPLRRRGEEAFDTLDRTLRD